MAGISTLGQEPAEAFFGLGSATVVDQIVVQYPNGEQETLYNVAADQVITITNAPPIPTASTWGVIAMALLLMIAGTFVFRRAVTGP